MVCLFLFKIIPYIDKKHKKSRFTEQISTGYFLFIVIFGIIDGEKPILM